MRKDFGRLVIERERRGSSAPNLKMRKTGRFRMESPDWEEWDYDGPLKIRTNGLYGVKHAYDRKVGEKEFSDVLQPVHGYLHKSIGRRWDEVFSELTAALGRGTWPIRHVLTSHALREVCTNTYVENWKVYERAYDKSYGDYFVDPRDGTLRKEADKPRHRYTPPALDRHHWKEGMWFVRIKGIWYLGAYTKNAALASIAPRPEPEAEKRYSRSRRGSALDELDRFWPNVHVGGTAWYFVKWRQAGKRELKALRGLRVKHDNHL